MAMQCSWTTPEGSQEMYEKVRAQLGLEDADGT
jgi:hypothetical protein